MKYPYTGLYFFCKELGAALLRQKPDDQMIDFYVPEKEKGVFGPDQKYLLQNHLHKFFPKTLPRYNIWHCTYQGSRYLPSKKRGLKIISTIHDLNFLHQGKTQSKQNKYLNQVQKLINQSDAVVTISHFVREQLSQHLNVDGKKVSVIYNGKNTPENLDFKKPQDAGDKPFFFAIGTITDKKNFHVLPAMLLNNDYDLIIAGITQSNSYHTKIIDEAKRLGVSARVHLIGPVSEEEKYWLFKNCAAFCFPSLAEGFGLPVIEAMQFGTPVILSKATSLPEIGGPHAIYFEDMDVDSINKAARYFLKLDFDDHKRKALIDWADQFQWDIAARKYVELYKNL